jgi:hypothetical protein
LIASTPFVLCCVDLIAGRVFAVLSRLLLHCLLINYQQGLGQGRLLSSFFLDTSASVDSIISFTNNCSRKEECQHRYNHNHTQIRVRPRVRPRPRRLFVCFHKAAMALLHCCSPNGDRVYGSENFDRARPRRLPQRKPCSLLWSHIYFDFLATATAAAVYVAHTNQHDNHDQCHYGPSRRDCKSKTTVRL